MKSLIIASLLMSVTCLAQVSPTLISTPQSPESGALIISVDDKCAPYMHEDPKGHCKITIVFESKSIGKVSCNPVTPPSYGSHQFECSYDLASSTTDPSTPIITRETVYKETKTCQTGWHLETWVPSNYAYQGFAIYNEQIPREAHYETATPKASPPADSHPDKCVQDKIDIPSPAETIPGNKGDGKHSHIDEWTSTKINPCTTVITGDMTVGCDINQLNQDTGLLEECGNAGCKPVPNQPTPMCPTKSGAWIPWQPSKGHTWHHDCVEIPLQKHWPVSTIK